jgi:putative oxidoreductase
MGKTRGNKSQFPGEKMKRLISITRILLGLIFTIFGLNHFLPFIPHPEMSGEALTYMTGLSVTGYFWPLLRGLELLCGLALLSNRLVPLALGILAPITLQITLFHVFLLPENLAMAIIMSLALAFLIKAHWNYFQNLFVVKAVNTYSIKK